MGLVWLPCHLPELVSDSGERPLGQLAVYILALSVRLTWLYNSTRASLPVVILLHAAVNSFAQLTMSPLQGRPAEVACGPSRALLALLALAVVRSAGPRTLTTADADRGHRPLSGAAA